MKIVFMGTPDYADTILKRLLNENSIEVAAVYTQPDRPAGRKRTVTPPPVKTTAQRAGIKCRQPLSLGGNEVEKEIRDESPDFIVVAAYGQLLPKSILDIAPCINLHASLLPKYRGASPIQQALLDGETITGVTSMLMEEGLDSGPMLAWSVTPVTLMDRKSDLFARLARMGGDLAVETLFAFDSLCAIPQYDADASYCKKITKEDGLVAFDLSSVQIYNRFRAYEGWPGIYLGSGLKLLDILPAEGEGEAGKILSVGEKSVIVACGTGAVEIAEVQPPSKKRMYAASYVRGKRIGVEDIFV